jgi:hypothetical protein
MTTESLPGSRELSVLFGVTILEVTLERQSGQRAALRSESRRQLAQKEFPQQDRSIGEFSSSRRARERTQLVERHPVE